MLWPALPSPAALPIQLASKLTPEMEARDAELAAGVETPAAAAAGPATAASVRFSEISAQLDDFNRFVSGITGSGGLLAYRVRGRAKSREGRELKHFSRPAKLLTAQQYPGTTLASDHPCQAYEPAIERRTPCQLPDGPSTYLHQCPPADPLLWPYKMSNGLPAYPHQCHLARLRTPLPGPVRRARHTRRWRGAARPSGRCWQRPRRWR